MKEYLPKLGLKTEGFEPFMVVDKLRRSYIYKNCEISIDTVKGLGDYIEIEYKGEGNDVKKVQDLLEDVLKEIGAYVGKRDYKGYAHNLLELKLKS